MVQYEYGQFLVFISLECFLLFHFVHVSHQEFDHST
uniref:Uncharacterized protein n=1 Tax=Anguilla anguilla TaxID=7936 RepID=A0A0E9SXD6_ANGAN